MPLYIAEINMTFDIIADSEELALERAHNLAEELAPFNGRKEGWFDFEDQAPHWILAHRESKTGIQPEERTRKQ